jgi:hypothetical protein
MRQAGAHQRLAGHPAFLHSVTTHWLIYGFFQMQVHPSSGINIESPFIAQSDVSHSPRKGDLVMNNSINYGNFIDLLIKSNDEFESYGIASLPAIPDPASTQPGNLASSLLSDSQETETWYGE